MAVAGSIALGHGASYPFKTTGAAEGPRITGRCGASYRLSAVEKGGEPTRTRRFGLEWVYRPVSKGPVIARFPEKAIAQFSSRRAQITKTTLALAEAYQKECGLAPDRRALASIRQFANAMTRRADEPGALDFSALLRGWQRASRVAELGTLRDLAQTIRHAPPRAGAATGAPGDTRTELAQTAGRLAPPGTSRVRKNARPWRSAAPLAADLGQQQMQLRTGAAGG